MHHLPHADLDSLYQLWRHKAPHTPLPARGDFTPEGDLRPWLGDIAIAEVEHAPLRFKARLVGTRIVAGDGRDVTGRYLDVAFPDRYETQIHPPFAAAVAAAQGVYSEIRFGSYLRYIAAQIVLPLADDGSTIDQLLVAFSLTSSMEGGQQVRLAEELTAGRAERKPFLYLPRDAG